MDRRSELERVGAHYDQQQMLVVREKTLAAVKEISRAIRPGMLEDEAHEAGRQVLKKAGLLRGWHGIKIRFGRNTLLTFNEPSEPGTVLQDDDIYFVDIGPVLNRCEGDAGDTFAVGNDPDMHRAVRDVRAIFDRVQEKWAREGVTGPALYAYAEAQSAALGWQLNLDVPGHRIGDFPHEAIFDGALTSAAFTPSNGLWILEIQIRHPTRPFGAFYEDMLRK
jgi:Xaa-Pro aminopeptidase